MPPFLAQEGLDLLHLLGRLSVKDMRDVLTLLVALGLHLVDTGFNPYLRGLDLLNGLIHLAHPLVRACLTGLDLGQPLLKPRRS